MVPFWVTQILGAVLFQGPKTGTINLTTTRIPKGPSTQLYPGAPSTQFFLLSSFFRLDLHHDQDPFAVYFLNAGVVLVLPLLLLVPSI